MRNSKKRSRYCPASWRNVPALKELAAAAKMHETIRLKYQQVKYQCIQDICLIESRLRQDEGALEKFCASPYWKNELSKPQVDQPDKLLHYLFVYLCRDRGDDNKTASLYKRAAQNLLASNLPRDRLAEELKARGGIRACAAKKCAEDGKRTYGISDRRPDSMPESVMDEKQSIAARTEASPEASIKASIKPIQPSTLEIEITHSELEDIMGLEKGDRAKLIIQHTSVGQKGWKRFIIEDYDIL